MKANKHISRKAVTYDDSGKPIDCLFCRIQQRKAPGDIIFEDEDFVVFKTIAPATSTAHLLVTPREHISNIASLSGPNDAKLIEQMIEIGKLSLDMIQPGYGSIAQYSFHVPPWNSIDHLHLHAIATPERKSYAGYFKYYPGAPWCKNAVTVIEELNQSENKTREKLYLCSQK